MADGIGSMSRSMLGIAGSDGTNTDCPQLTWKTITKGKRSRKAVGRPMLASETPKTVGEFSGSDTDKFDEPSLADGLGCVPIKKRRRLRSPSQNIQHSPPQQASPSLHSEKSEQLSDNDGLSCNQSSDLHSDIQKLAGALENNSDDMVNLSGIALLATAACFDSIDGDLDNVKQDVDVTEEYPTLRKCDDKVTVTIPVGEPIQVQGRSDLGQEKPVADPDNVKHDVTEESLTLMKCNDALPVTIPVAEPMHVQGGSDPEHDKCFSFAEDSPAHIIANNNAGSESIAVSPKVDRCFWDLNKVMEEWVVPQEDMVVRNSSVGETSIEGRCSAQLDSVNNGNSVNHVSQASVDVATSSFHSKVDDNEHVGSTLLKNYEQQIILPKVSQSKDAEEDSQKTSELSEDRTILVENSSRKECETMDVGMLPKSDDMSTSEISNADRLAVCGSGDGTGQEEEKAIVTDAMHTNDASDHQDQPVSTGEIVKTSISLDSVKTLVDDDHGLSDATQNISELQVDYDSPYEDGELRLPALYSCGRNEIVYDEEENECVDYESDDIVGEESDPGDHPGSEVVEAAGSEGSQAPEKKYSVPAQQISETVTSNSTLNFKEENNLVKLKPEAKRHSNQGSGTTDELPVMPLVQDNNDSMRRERNFDHVDRFNSRGPSYPREFGGLTREKLQPYYTSNMSSKFGDSFSRSERGRGGADRSVIRRGSSFGGNRQLGGYNSHWNYRNSTNRYQSRGPEDNWQQTRTRNAADSIDKFDDVNSYEHDQSSKFPAKGIQRTFFTRRSPVERDDYHGDQGGFTPAGSGYNKRGNFGKLSGRGFGRGRREEEYAEPAVDAAAVSSGRFSGGHVSRGEQRGFSPSNRAPHVSGPSWKSRSRSRTRSPHTWQSQRERNLNTRRRSRSPEFRSESSVERSKGPVPFQKRNFNADYTERFISPPKARFSPTRNNRWVNDNRNFTNPPLRHHRRSPPGVGAFRQQSQRFGGQSGRFGTAGDNKSEENCGNGKHDQRFGLVDRNLCSDGKHDQRFGLVDRNVRHSGTSNISRRPRHDDTNVNCEDDDNSNNNNNEGRDMSNFGGAGYEERFLSSQRESNRWSDERDLDNNNNNDSPSSRHGNSPSGMLRRAQRPKQDDYFRQSVTSRPGRFTNNSVGGDDWGNNSRRRNLE